MFTKGQQYTSYQIMGMTGVMPEIHCFYGNTYCEAGGHFFLGKDGSYFYEGYFEKSSEHPLAYMEACAAERCIATDHTSAV